jgi:hypothetical protein
LTVIASAKRNLDFGSSGGSDRRGIRDGTEVLSPASAGLPLRGRGGPGKGADPPGPPRVPNTEVDRVGKRSPAERHFRQAVL